MLSLAAQAALNLEQARDLRAEGLAYREIRRRLGISVGQLAHIRRTLKREKGAQTRLARTRPSATPRDLPVRQCALPRGLRDVLHSSGYRTLGEIADRMVDPELRGLEMLAGIGPHRASLVTALLERFDLLPGPADLKAEIERIFPEFKASE